MRRVFMPSLAAGLVFLAGQLFAQASTFELGFSGPGSLSGNPGDPVSGDYNCTLTSTLADIAQPGAQGWSISMTADNAGITSITTDGTDVDASFSGGFKKTETTTKGAGDCTGKNGAVSAIVLSFTEDKRLGAGAMVIAKINVSATIPPAPGPGEATLSYVDKCQGAGQPVDNNITEAGATVAPGKGSKKIRLIPEVTCCPSSSGVGFSATKISSAVVNDGILDAGDKCFAAGGAIKTETLVGQAPADAHAFANITSSNAGGGVQGWSLSIAVNGDVVLKGVTTDGTPGVDNNFSGGFKKTEPIDPAKNADQRGVVSAIVLSFTELRVLPAIGTETVLDITLGSGQSPQPDSDVTGEVKFQSGLRGAGQPVQNALTIDGGTVDACNFAQAQANVVFAPITKPPSNKFQRGNANNDRKVNIADPIWIINELFRQGPKTACAAAADANSDGMVDSSDALFLIAYQFQAGPTPAAPFPDCDEAAPESCAEAQSSCP